MEQAKLTVIEMFKKRGYELIEDNVDIIGKKQCGGLIRAFFDVYKFNGEKAREIISTMYNLNINHSLVVYTDSITPASRKIIRSIEDDMEIELFSVEELQYDITKHRLQPKFDLLSKEEADQFRSTYGVKFSTLLRSDPISRFYFFQRGDIVKVTRKGEYIDYRIVRGV